MKTVSFFRKIYDAVEGPPHAQGQGGGEDPMLDARVVARGIGSPTTSPSTAPAPAPTKWVPSQQEEEPK
jgi:hypothetical protein